jgi:hypothetical protein
MLSWNTQAHNFKPPGWPEQTARIHPRLREKTNYCETSLFVNARKKRDAMR